MAFMHPLPFLKLLCTSLTTDSTFLPSSLLEDFCVYFPCVVEKRYSSVCATVFLAAFLFPDWYHYWTLPVFRDVSLLLGFLE